MRVFVSGGGTGGHFFPALALIECLLEEKIDTIFVGSERGIEKRLSDKLPVQSYFLQAYPFMGRGIGEKLTSVVKNLRGALKVAHLLEKRDRAVIFGGYASLPLGLACSIKGTSLYLHEQNSVPSKTNRLLWRFAKRVFITFEYTKRYFPKEKTVKTALPVRKSLLKGLSLSREQALKKLGLEDKTTLLVVGGSQGASFLNQIAPEVFQKTGWQGIHITGERDYEKLEEFYKHEKLKVLALPFSHDMHILYRASTVALSRGGASTITELSLFGVPSVFVPYPYAVGDHQYYNAKEIEDLGGGLVLRQEEVSVERLLEKIMRILKDHEVFSKNIKTFANPLACEEIKKYILYEEGK